MRATLDPLAIRGLRRLLAAWHPRLVHAHCDRSHAVALAALVGRRSAIPLIVTKRTAAPPRGRTRHGARVARFIAITAAVRDALVAGGIERERVALVYPGVPVHEPGAPRDWRRECRWPADTVVAGVVGPLTEPARRSDLVRLLGSLDAATRARLGLVLLGGRAEGRTAVGPTRAYAAGFVHEIPAALAGLDLLVHPGEADGLGTALVEGMALRVPVVAFATGGVREILAPEAGVLVPPGDAGALAAALRTLVTDAERRAALAGAAPAQARRFSVEAMVERTLAVYRAALPPGTPFGTDG